MAVFVSLDVLCQPYTFTSVKVLEDLRELLGQLICSFVKPDHTRNTNPTTLEILDASLYPVHSHAHSRESMNSRFRAEVVDLIGLGFQLQQSMIDGLGEGRVREPRDTVGWHWRR